MNKTHLAISMMATLVGFSSVASASSQASGWATVDGSVTGGEGAKSENIYVVENRAQLIEALYGSADANLNNPASDVPKIIYIKGTIDLTAGADGKSMTGSDFMAMCEEETGYSDYDTFYNDYRAAYDPAVWNKQDLAKNGRPPMVNGALEDARGCYQKAQASYAVLRVGSNTSLLGVGNDAHIKFGTLRLGTAGKDMVKNIVIRNIEFSDAFDFFPQWSPTDSFKIDKKEFGQGNCSDKFVSDEVNPYGCNSAEGGRWNSEYDLIAIDNAQQVWVDHNTFSDGERTDEQFPPVFAAPYNIKEQKVQHHDGLVDITNAATKITVSYNVFKNHDKTNLLGGSDKPDAKKGYGPGAIDVTFHHNIWDNTGQRMPRLRFGRVHTYNNYFNLDATKGKEAGKYGMMDAVILSTAAKIYSENNVFDIKNDGEGKFEHKIIGYYSRTNNEERCIKTGDFEEGSCGTYFYAEGTLLNGKAVDLNAIAQKNQQSSSSNAKLTMLDPNDENAFWLPKQTYQYKVDAADTVKENLLKNAGAGKLDIKH